MRVPGFTAEKTLLKTAIVTYSPPRPQLPAKNGSFVVPHSWPFPPRIPILCEIFPWWPGCRIGPWL
jgi:hypothetical protein